MLLNFAAIVMRDTGLYIYFLVMVCLIFAIQIKLTAKDELGTIPSPSIRVLENWHDFFFKCLLEFISEPTHFGLVPSVLEGYYLLI